MAPRDYKQAQANKSKIGKSHEDEMHSFFQNILEKAGLDHVFHIYKPPEILAWPEKRGTALAKFNPDLVVVRAADNRAVLFGGAKVSFRERLYQDVWVAEQIKRMFPGVMWVEQTRSEQLDDSLEKIEHFMATKMSYFCGYIDVMYSTVSRDSQNAARVAITNFLKSKTQPDPSWINRPLVDVDWSKSQTPNDVKKDRKRKPKKGA